MVPGYILVATTQVRADIGVAGVVVDPLVVANAFTAVAVRVRAAVPVVKGTAVACGASSAAVVGLAGSSRNITFGHPGGLNERSTGAIAAHNIY